MQKLHSVVKYVSSTIANHKNCNDVLDQHHCLPTNQLEQDHNGTRLVAACKPMKSALRICQIFLLKRIGGLLGSLK